MNNAKILEENNRMREITDVSKKIRDTKGTFHAKMGTVKDRIGMDLPEAKRLRRGGNKTQKNVHDKHQSAA